MSRILLVQNGLCYIVRPRYRLRPVGDETDMGPEVSHWMSYAISSAGAKSRLEKESTLTQNRRSPSSKRRIFGDIQTGAPEESPPDIT